MATYYVDGIAGANSNNGLTKGTAWSSPPGLGHTKTVSPGSVIYIRRGSAWSGILNINSTFGYQGGATRLNPITIMVDETWGSGAVALTGGIWVNQQGIKLDGAAGDIDDPINGSQASGYLWLINTSVGGGAPIDTPLLVQKTEQSINHLKISGSSGVGGHIIKPWSLTNSEFHYIFVDGLKSSNQVAGWSMGAEGGRYCNNVYFDHCYILRLGPTGGAMTGGDNYWVGFHGVDNPGPITMNHCQSIDNGGRLYDFGGLNSKPGTYVLNYCQARLGHASGFGNNGEPDSASYQPAMYYNYCIARDNADNGFHFYGTGGYIYMNQCISGRNGGAGLFWYSSDPEGDSWINLACKNSVFFQNYDDLHYATLTNTTNDSSDGRYPGCTAFFNRNAYWGSNYLAHMPGTDANRRVTYAQGRPGENGPWATLSARKFGNACDINSLCPATNPDFRHRFTDINNNDFHIGVDSTLRDAGYSLQNMKMAP